MPYCSSFSKPEILNISKNSKDFLIGFIAMFLCPLSFCNKLLQSSLPNAGSFCTSTQIGKLILLLNKPAYCGCWYCPHQETCFLLKLLLLPLGLCSLPTTSYFSAPLDSKTLTHLALTAPSSVRAGRSTYQMDPKFSPSLTLPITS